MPKRLKSDMRVKVASWSRMKNVTQFNKRIAIMIIHYSVKHIMANIRPYWNETTLI